VNRELFQFETERGAGSSTEAAELAAIMEGALQFGQETSKFFGKLRATAEIDRLSPIRFTIDDPIVGAEAACAAGPPRRFHAPLAGEKVRAGQELRPDAVKTAFVFLGVFFYFFHFLVPDERKDACVREGKRGNG
jgi:hypothetical protein